ncbi:MAG: branched-chain amino acid ABC transporter permease [Betaproteobacteria bacterium]|nr:branched-chain amino acid ABC transporter permease [Betaproteobacteria bacterium]MDE2211233.1 branched-chain amino acid ABC transporter permease [Betaproteobacteria bacterium]
MDWSSWWETYSTLVLSIGVYGMLALSIYLTLSCGLLSLANAAFMGIGAYVSAIITLQYEWPFAIALLLGTAAPATVALLVGIPVLRLSGVYLAMATLGFGEVVRVVLLNLDITGGPLGLNGIPPLTSGWHVLLALACTIALLQAMRRSRIGRAFEAIREDETAARLMGIATDRVKLLAFVLGAAIAGLAGGLNAHYTFTLSPGNFGFENAVDILTMAVLGGIQGLLGPLLGGAILTLLPELLRGLQEFRMAANGLILIVVVLFLPQGLWDPGRFRRWLKK